MYLEHVYAVAAGSILFKWTGKGGGVVLSASASEISAYIATFWDRGPLDNTTTHRNPMALEWHKS